MKMSFVRLSTKDLATLAQRVISTSQKASYDMVANHPILLKLTATFTAYDKVYARNAYSGMGKDVAEFDRLRDMPFKGMREVLHGLVRVDGLSNQQDAIDLYNIFDQMGLDMDGYSYSSESAQMKKLVEALDAPANQTKIANVHLTEMYAMLKTNYAAFEEIYDTQNATNSDLRLQKSASAMRTELETDLRNYLNIVEAMSSVEGWNALNSELSGFLKAAANSTVSAVEKTATDKPA